ncbi:hypothetical protein AAC387_Pa02g0003 [Persea americana]
MQSMGNEKPKPTNFPGRPTYPSGAAAQPAMPFLSSGLAAGLEASVYRPAPPVRFNGPSVPTPISSYSSPDVGGHQHPHMTNYPSMAQLVTPYGPPPTHSVSVPPPPMGQPHVFTPVSARPQYQVPLVPMGPSHQSVNPIIPDGGNMPPSTLEASFSAPKQILQPSLHGYPSGQPNSAAHVPPVQVPPFAAHHGGPPVVVQGLVEEFNSLSIGSVPGSVDSGIDSKVLPRPLDGDVDPSFFVEMYPLICHPRYLRLTTCSLPNSQSLLSRWHLPLGVVVHPLAEAPDGEEVPVVNFGPTGIIRCRRCRTYINPYVTFTDGGRKWHCNICALLNDGVARVLNS